MPYISKQIEEGTKIEFVTCPSCENLTPQYVRPKYGFNCIYENCEKHIPFYKIIRLSKEKVKYHRKNEEQVSKNCIR